MKNMITVKIDDREYTVPEQSTILEACRAANVNVPTLCYFKDLNPLGACRVCVVEVKTPRGMQVNAACVTPATNGMQIYTHTANVLKSRKTSIELLLSNHNNDCNNCAQSGKCDLQRLAQEYDCDAHRFEGEKTPSEVEVTPYLIRDNSKCILCRRCVAMCKNRQHVAVIGANNRGFKTFIGTAYGEDLTNTGCVSCGQCITVCPTGALREKDDTDKVFAALNNPELHVVMMPAPAVRVAIGEEFGYPIGTNQQGKMVAAMRRLGVSSVLDVDFAADLTIMEEGYELLDRLQNGGVLPMFTSCSPGWINFIEQYYPEYLPNLSTCKSPQMMAGALVKTYYAQKHGLDPKKIFAVTVMPCTAKKGEIARPEMCNKDGIRDLDATITTREFARMVRKCGIDFANLPEEDFDPLLGHGTEAGLLFGATGGVMEAALRTVYEVVEQKPLAKLDFTAVRGTKGIKKASVKLGGTDVKVAVVSGIENAHEIMQQLKAGKLDAHFVEVMCCPGGCVTGGGQPIQSELVWSRMDVRQVRAKAIYDTDKKSKERKSHENTQVQALYEDFLGKPNGHLSHELLHTHYKDRTVK